MTHNSQNSQKFGSVKYPQCKCGIVKTTCALCSKYETTLEARLFPNHYNVGIGLGIVYSRYFIYIKELLENVRI